MQVVLLSFTVAPQCGPGTILGPIVCHFVMDCGASWDLFCNIFFYFMWCGVWVVLGLLWAFWTYFRTVWFSGAAVLPLRLRHLDVRGGEQSQLAAQLPDVADAGQKEPRRDGRVGGALQDLPLRLSAQRHGQAGGLWLHLLQRCK